MKKYSNFSQKPQGFTMIEFLIASALAMIVIVAAASTYFMTRKINIGTQSRLNIQQNLRVAASMMMRDARNTGSFGCFSTTGGNTTTNNINSQTPIFPALNDNALLLNSSEKNGYGVNYWTSNFPNFTKGVNPEKVVMFIYGKGSTGITGNVSSGTLTTFNVTDYANDADIQQTVTDKGKLIISNCNSAYLASVSSRANGSINVGSVTATNLANGSSAEIMVSRLYASAYVLGTINGTKSFLRYDLKPDGKTWEGPQLLASNVNSMDVNFTYVTNCGNNKDTTINQEKFKVSNSLDTTELPAMVSVKLNYNISTNGSSTQTASYIINASIRSGNICSTTTPV